MKLILIALGQALSGCASMQQAINAGEASALVSARAANDNVINVWVTAACATPFSAAVRNPRIIPALRALCVPGGYESNPAALLDAVKP